MLKPIEPKMAPVSGGGAFAIVAIDNGGRRLFH